MEGDHEMFLTGSLLDAVQEARLFPDSKTFVDCPLKVDVEVAQARFTALQRHHSGRSIPKSELEQFVAESFDEVGSDVCSWEPSDWQPATDAELTGHLPEGPVCDLFHNVHALWKTLGKRPDVDRIADAPARHTLLPLPHSTVVPGDRFRETYYWDSYWVIRGLVVSGMCETARGMVMNLLSLVERYGHVPNGSRTYYLNRTQPPLLSQMVRQVYEATSDRKLLEVAVPLLRREHQNFVRGPRAVTILHEGKVWALSRYWANWASPRPESYREDKSLVANMADGHAQRVLRDLASAAESGWDFSSRWLEDPYDLSTIRTTAVVPVDLNALLYQMENDIADFAEILTIPELALQFRADAADRAQAMDAVMWDASSGQWRDFILLEYAGEGPHGGRQSAAVCASNYVPLWCRCVPPEDPRALSAVKSLEASELWRPGGVATSTVASGQQWDAPNAWPPLQHMLIEGLARAGKAGKILAQELAHRWINTNMLSFRRTGYMHEKWDAERPGTAGGGGEYAPQVGFGWSNGVLLVLLQEYGASFDASALGRQHREACSPSRDGACAAT